MTDSETIQGIVEIALGQPELMEDVAKILDMNEKKIKKYVDAGKGTKIHLLKNADLTVRADWHGVYVHHELTYVFFSRINERPRALILFLQLIVAAIALHGALRLREEYESLAEVVVNLNMMANIECIDLEQLGELVEDFPPEGITDLSGPPGMN